MAGNNRTPKLLLFATLAGCALAQQQAGQKKDPPPCSPEKVNNDCTLRLDRSYPVAQPTIQVRTGKRVSVIVYDPLQFESLLLEFQSAQAVAPTDPTQAMVTALLGQAKSLTVSTRAPGPSLLSMLETAQPGDFERAMRRAADIQTRLDELSAKVNQFTSHSIGIYAELSEVAQTISPETLFGHTRSGALTERKTPRPWAEFPAWRTWMLCEIGSCPAYPAPETPVSGILAEAAAVTNDLAQATAACPTPPAEVPDCQIKWLAATDQSRFSKDEKTEFANAVASLRNEFAALQAAAAGVPAVAKDLGNYYANISQITTEGGANPVTLGYVTDPLNSAKEGAFVSRLLGRQVVFAINAVNLVTTAASSVPSSTQKKSVSTVTVMFGDPIVEASAGAFFSSLPNRSFANQTVVTQTPGGPPSQGNVYIAETTSVPTIVPFAAVNLRLGHDFLVKKRRGAFYLTGALGINAFSGSTEFGLGPSFAWRSLMFSAFWHEGRDVRLTQQEYTGEVWCNATAAVGSIPKCGGNPPSPSTEKFWQPAFAVGVSVRVPAVFGSGK